MASPIPLYEAINQAVTLYQQLKAHGDQNNAQLLANVAGQLATAFQTIRSQAPNLGNDGAAHDAAVKTIESIVTVDDSIDLKLFFQQVGSAVVDAQKQLDAASLDYNRELPPGSPVQKTLFAIPTVKAELKLGFSQISSKGVNVIVFQSTEQKQKYGESTITFEIAAAPLPPNQNTLPGPAPRGPEFVAEALAPEPHGEEPEFIMEAATREFEFAVVAPPPPLTFPLAADARVEAIAALKAAIGMGASELLARDERLVVLPSDKDTRAHQDYVYLLPGSRTAGEGPGLRAFRIWRGAYAAGVLDLTVNRFSAPGAVENGGIVVPPNSDALRRISDLSGLVRNIGDVLVEIVVRVRQFEPDFLVSSATDPVLYDRILSAYGDLVGDESFVILRDRAADGGATLLRPVMQPGTREWAEFHAVLFGRRPAANKLEPRIHIPDVRVLEEWAATSKENLVLLAHDLERLLRRLTAIFAHAGR